MFKKLKQLYKKFIDRLCEIHMEDEISSWIYDYWSDLYNEYCEK